MSIIATSILEEAEKALEAILATDKGNVYASRKGKVGAVRNGQQTMVFRRVVGKVHFEVWDTTNGQHPEISYHDLPEGLEFRAGQMLDNL